MSEIKYTFEKLVEGSKAIYGERRQMQDYDRKFLDGLESDLSMFHSDFADKARGTIGNMRDVGTDDLIQQLDQYSATLSLAEQTMRELDDDMAKSFSGGVGNE